MSITQGLHRSVQQQPDRIATICRGRVRTFREQFHRVGRLAGGLRAMGLAPGARVAIVSQNSDRMLEVLLAVSWSGFVFVPLNTRWSSRELAHAMNDVEAECIVVDDAFAPLVPELRQLCG